MKENEFRAFLQHRKMPPENIESDIDDVKDFEEYLAKSDAALEQANLRSLDGYVTLLISEGRNTEGRLVAIARYCRFTKKNDLFIYIAGLVNAVEVLPGIGKRIGELAGEDVRSKVFEGIDLPPLGAPQEAYPPLTHRIMQRMEKELSPARCREVLTWNYHGIPTESFLGSKERYEKAEGIDEHLRDEHKRFVEEISHFMNEGTVWCEQEITPEVIDLVKADQEISAGRREGDLIYVTKIPYAPKEYLEERDPRMKRFYACHCPLARTAILEGKPKISSTFCYCSAGFTKLRYDVIFGEPVEIEMLESVLKGDMRCRFAITIPAGRTR